jgi:hypothetical protein
MVHALHQGAFNDADGTVESQPDFFDILFDEIRDPFDESMLEPITGRCLAPG